MKKNKVQQGERIYPVLRCEMVPITDPDEIAALERRIRAAEKMLAGSRSNGKKVKPRKVK